MPTNNTEASPISTLRTGYLVSLNTSVRGNVSYTKEVIEPEHKVRGAAKTTWQTERTITDPEEHKKANQARMKARQIIASVCAKSAFGYMCPKNSLDKLDLAIKTALGVAAKFNRTATLSRVEVNVIKGEIAQSDVQAIRAINSEVRELLKLMSEGVKNLDVKTVRAAASKARSVGQMLSPEASAKIKGAIEVARGAARKITKAGERAAQEIDREAIKSINQARTAFVDLGMDDEVGEAEASSRAVDLGAEEPELVQAELPLHKTTKPKKAIAKKAATKSKTTSRRRTTAEARA